MKSTLLVCLLSLVTSVAAGADDANNFVLHTEQQPPFQYQKDGQIQGDTVDVVKELFKRAGMGFSMQMQPWDSAFAEAKKNPGHGIFALVRTPERESSFQWVGPLSSTRWVFYAKKGRHIKLTKVRDALAYRIGAYQSDAKALYLSELGATTLSLVADDATNAKRLENGQIDLWVTGARTGKYFADEAGFQDFEEVLTIREDFGYLGLNATTSPGKVLHLLRTLEQMRAEGRLEKVIKLK